MTDTLQHAELSIIGAILLTEGRIFDELDFDPTTYSDKRLESAHQIMMGMHSSGEPIEALTVLKYAAANGEHIDPLMLHHAASVTPTAASANYYAKIVSDAAAARKLTQAAEKLANQANQGLDPEQVIQAAQQSLEDARGIIGTRQVKPIGHNIEAYLDRLERETVFRETAWPQINRLIGGLISGALYVVGARPGVGKSVAALQLAQSLEKHGAVAFISLEMLEDDLKNRLVANEKKIPIQRLTAGNLEDHDWHKMGEWIQGIAERRIYVSDSTTSTIHDIKRFVQDVHRSDPLAGVVIDYLQLISQSVDRVPEQEFIAETTRQLKLMALQMNIPVILLSQLNRGPSNREDKLPRASDLRGSGAIEQDADVIILLHRDLKGDESYRMFMNVEKNRRGPAGNTEMVFQGHYSNIHDEIPT